MSKRETLDGDAAARKRAEAKRTRKAAKRRRDAERTAAGQLSRRRALLWLCALERVVRRSEAQP